MTTIGDIYDLDGSLIACGYCEDMDLRKKLFSILKPDILITDPPYCSGGFQESGKKKGSVGVRESTYILNDQLSTRGYVNLMSRLLTGLDVSIAYIFTDWKMWTWLYDSFESSGFGVRSMIVWAKPNAGLGLGWRPQHELIACGVKNKKIKFELSNGTGNVIAEKRTGNNLHPTEKPVELIKKIIGVTPNIEAIFDPFAGSGTTLMAAEELNKKAVLVEAVPEFCDVAISRWETTTGKKAKKIDL